MQLSTLVDKLNERFGTEFTPADQLFFDQVKGTAVANEQLRQAVMANSLENFEPVFNKQLENLFVERMDGNEGHLHTLDERRILPQYRFSVPDAGCV